MWELQQREVASALVLLLLVVGGACDARDDRGRSKLSGEYAARDSSVEDGAQREDGALVADAGCGQDCQNACTNTCLPGAKRCAGAGAVQTCGNFDADECLEWGTAQACSDGAACSEGACVQRCGEGCNRAPTPSCVDASTLRLYRSQGSCSDGVCTYGYDETACEFGCTAGACQGPPVCTGWQQQKIGSGANSAEVSLALDALGRAHVAYRRGYGEVVYLTDASGAWQLQVVDATGNLNPSSGLALAPDGSAHVVFADVYGTTFYAHNRNGSWVRDRVRAATSFERAIAVGPAGDVHISLHDSTTDKFLVLTDRYGGWSSSASVNNTGGRFSSLALDAGGYLHVAFSSHASKLVYGTNRHGAWSSGNPNSHFHRFENTSIAVDGSDWVHLAVYDETQSSILVHTNKSGGWNWSEHNVDPSVELGPELSLAADTQGYTHLAYLDRSTAKLRYATNKSGGWIQEDVTAGHVSSRGLAIDSLGRPRLAYRSGSDVLVATPCP